MSVCMDCLGRFKSADFPDLHGLTAQQKLPREAIQNEAEFEMPLCWDVGRLMFWTNLNELKLPASRPMMNSASLAHLDSDHTYTVWTLKLEKYEYCMSEVSKHNQNQSKNNQLTHCDHIDTITNHGKSKIMKNNYHRALSSQQAASIRTHLIALLSHSDLYPMSGQIRWKRVRLQAIHWMWRTVAK